jgi:GAF domain-containing protein/HAMP domain-containing protein
MTNTPPLKPFDKSSSLETNSQESQSSREGAFHTTALCIAFVCVILAGRFFLSNIWSTEPEKTALPSWVLTAAFLIGAGISYGIAKNKSIHGLIARSRALNFITQFLLVLVASLVAGTGVIAVFLILIVTITISIVSSDQFQENIPIHTAIIVGIITALVGEFSPFNHISLPELNVYGPAIFGILVMTYTILLAFEFVHANLRTKLITTTLVLILLPITIFAFFQISYSQSTLRNQNIKSLQFAASQSQKILDDFLASNLDRVTSDAKLPEFAEFLSIPESSRLLTSSRDLSLISRALTTSQFEGTVSSYGLLDSHGFNVYDTDTNFVKTYEKNNDYFLIPFQTGQSYISHNYIWGKKDPFLVFSAPIRNSGNVIVGVLRIRYSGQVLQQLMARQIGMVGSRSYPILVDENFIRLADTINPSYVFLPIKSMSYAEIRSLRDKNYLPASINHTEASSIVPQIEVFLNRSQTYPSFEAFFPGLDQNSAQLAAVTTTNQNWHLIYVQDQQYTADIMNTQKRLTALIAAILAGIISIFTAFLASVFTNPIVQLTETADRIATGDLNGYAYIKTNDEVGSLANSFNLMTSQLRKFINELEDRVRDRTQELSEQNEFLRYRTRQLQTVSDVARSVASNQELEILLNQVAVLISERFGFYHVGIFLNDENGEYTTLRAANSEGGKHMLQRQHKLKIGKVGIVGNVASSGIARIASQVGDDSVYFDNPDLPLTKSEMALALKVSNKIIGAMDVQSTQVNAFTEEDIELFGILADQIAIAIVNNQLYENSNRALQELSKLHRQYIREEWLRESHENQFSNFRYTPQGIVKSDQLIKSEEIDSILLTGKPLIKNSVEDPVSSSPASMTIPIMLRGEPIGVIQIQNNPGESRSWNENDINTVQSVTDQIAQALENARLFKQTLRKAERDRRVLEITSKIRSTNDFNTMIQIAMDELQKTLNVNRTQIVFERESLNHKGVGTENNHQSTGQTGLESD